jgi:hypothetical protein
MTTATAKTKTNGHAARARAEAEGLDGHDLHVLGEHVAWLTQLAADTFLRGGDRRILSYGELFSWAAAGRALLAEVQRLRASAR